MKPYDLTLRLHEAAHAVTAEVLRPGCVLGIQMDVVPGEPTLFWGTAFGAGTDAVCSWRMWDTYDPDLHVATAAGREGELIRPHETRLDGGDRLCLREWATPRQRARARRRAKSLVKTHELAIRRVAAALADRRVLTGDEIRELIAAR